MHQHTRGSAPTPSVSAEQLKPHRSAPHRLHRRGTRLVLAATAGLLILASATTSQAVTKVTVPNPGGLVAVGPVNSDNGFPAWYQDSAGVRVEPCIDGDDPLCGFLPGDIPNPDAPLSFPDNWPGELFYQLVDSSLTLPGGGKATLTLGLEASFANGDPLQGDQITFARTRVTVVGGPRSSTVTFKHPFGELTVDLDATGKGRIVQDVSPAIGNFTTALKGNFGPFLKWDPAVAPAAPAGYLGDPGQTHAVVGGRNGFNAFTAVGADGTTLATTDQFGVSGKVATNTGVTGDYAVVNGGYLDVFASSTGDQLEVVGVDGQYAQTPMTNDLGTSRHYARLALADGAKAMSVTVRNLADKPMSTATIKIADARVTQAEYDGTNLVVAATSTSYPLTVDGVGTLPDAAAKSFPVAAPPAVVTVRSASGAPATLPVTVNAGKPTAPGLPYVPPSTDPGATTVTSPDNPAPPADAAPVVSVAKPADTLPGASVTLDASATTGAAAYQWSQVSAPAGTKLSGDTTAKATVTLPYVLTSATTTPVADWAPVTFKVTATSAAGAVSEQTVVVGVKKDVLTITAGARHRLRTELRVDGTSLIDGQAGARTPATQVTVWDTSVAGKPVKLGTVPVDTLGAWSLRQKPGPATQVTSVLVQTSRGGTATSAVAR
jgi:hypothetical protein